VLLRALVRVLELTKNIRLVIVGDGPERGNIEKLIEKLGIAHKVVLTGMREDIPALLAVMDIFVLCSKTEGMPLTLLEAMASGKAIVSSGVGGIPDIIRDGENGLLVPPEDEEKLAVALLTLIRDRSLAARLRNQARKDAEQRYSTQQMVRAYEALYVKYLNG